MQNRGIPPLCNLGRKFEYINGQNLGEDFFLGGGGEQNGLNLSEDFFFGLHLILGSKTGLNLSEYLFFWFSPNFGEQNGLFASGEIFRLVFIILKFSDPPPPPPPFQNPAYATANQHFKMLVFLKGACQQPIEL